MWQLLSWDVCFLVLGASRSLNVESSLKYCQQSGKINTNRQPHLVISGILCCFSQLLQCCPPAWAGPGWGGSSQVQPDLIELGLWRENLLWMFLLIRNQLVGRHKGRVEWWEQNIWHNTHLARGSPNVKKNTHPVFQHISHLWYILMMTHCVRTSNSGGILTFSRTFSKYC